MKLLHLDSSITGDGSASRAISAAIVERVIETYPAVGGAGSDPHAPPPPPQPWGPEKAPTATSSPNPCRT